MVKVVCGNNVNKATVIVDGSTTLRKVLEDNGIDYSHGNMMLDGATLRPGDLDKTFDDFGIAESCYLVSVQKADNAATATVVGQVVVITSGVSADDIKTVKKYRPEALVLKGGKNDEEILYAMGISGGMGRINKIGAEFGAVAHDGSGKATITITLPDDVKDVKEYVSDTYGRFILLTNQIEAKFPAVLEEIAGEKATIAEAIKLA